MDLLALSMLNKMCVKRGKNKAPGPPGFGIPLTLLGPGILDPGLGIPVFGCAIIVWPHPA
jgi:hypothetical protein